MQTCQEDDGRKDSSSDSELKISQQLLDQELQVHQERLIQLLDQGDNEIFVEQEASILTADLSGTCAQCMSMCPCGESKILIFTIISPFSDVNNIMINVSIHFVLCYR